MMKLNPSQLKEGMCVGDDVTTSDGRLLLKKGTVLTNAFIQKLTTLNIDEVLIETKTDQEESSSDSKPIEISQEVKEDARNKFIGLEMNAVLENLLTLTEKHLQEMKLQKKEA